MSFSISNSAIEQDLLQIRPFVRQIRINEDDEIEFKKTFCFCGTMNVTQAVKLICVSEMVIAVIFFLQAPDLILLNGKYFYFDGLFEGYGLGLFIAETIVILSCIISALLLLHGMKSARPRCFLPHLLWQAAFIAGCLLSCALLIWLTLTAQLLRPAAVVLVIVIVISTLIEIWWLNVVYQSYRFTCCENHIQRQWRKESQYSKKSIIASGLLDVQEILLQSDV